MSNVTIEEYQEPAMELPASNQPGHLTAKTAAIIADFNMSVQVEAGKAVDRAMVYAEKLARDMRDRAASDLKDTMEKLRADMMGFNRPKVMAVKIGQDTRKLSKPASPYLGDVLINSKLGRNTLLVGPAGSGKTTIAYQVAEALGRPFFHNCFSVGTSESHVIGRRTGAESWVDGPFTKAYREGGVYLGDEYDACDPNTQMCINSAVSPGSTEFYCMASGENIKRHENFVFLAAANTFGKGADAVYTGRNRLDGAALDRFTGCIIEVDYSKDIEEQICPHAEIREILWNAREKLRGLKSTEVISTRTLDAAYLLFTAGGVDWKTIVKRITAGWADGLAKQVGLDGSKVSKKPKTEAKDKPVEERSSAEIASDSPF